MIYVVIIDGAYDSVLETEAEAESYAAEMRETGRTVTVISDTFGRNSLSRECWETTVDLRSGLCISPINNHRIRQLMSVELYTHYVSSPVKGRDYRCFVRSFVSEGHMQKLIAIMRQRYAVTQFMENVNTNRLPKE